MFFTKKYNYFSRETLFSQAHLKGWVYWHFKLEQRVWSSGTVVYFNDRKWLKLPFLDAIASLEWGYESKSRVCRMYCCVPKLSKLCFVVGRNHTKVFASIRAMTKSNLTSITQCLPMCNYYKYEVKC